MAPSPRTRTNAAVTLVMLGLVGAFVAANQSPTATATNVYSVAASQPTLYLQNPAGPNQRAVLAVTNMDLTSPRAVKLTPLSETPNTTAPLTPLPRTHHFKFELTSHRPVPARPEPVDQPPKTRRFLVHTGDGPFNDPRFFHTIPARCVGFNDCVAVFVHPVADIPTQDSIDQLLTTFTQQHEVVANLFGTHAVDVDGDGRFCVLLIPKPERNLPTAFVRPADFNTSLDAGLSNAADMLYLSCQPLESQQLRTLMTHEYAHAVCCSLRPEVIEEDWLHEAIAHLTEHLSNSSPSNIDHRISRFLENTHRYPLAVPDYFSANLYREHGCRGATATFLTSANRHYGGTDSLLPKLVQSPATGIQNITSAAKVRFPAVMRRWTEDLLKTSTTPHTLGQFVILGPRTVTCNDEPVNVSVAPTATVFFELSDAAYQLTIDGTLAPQTTIQVSNIRPSLVFKSAVHSNGDIEIHVHCPHNKTQRLKTQGLVCGAETVVDGKLMSLGLRKTQSITNPATFRFNSDSATSGPITVKAFAELSDGTIITGRTNIAPTAIQLTAKPATSATW